LPRSARLLRREHFGDALAAGRARTRRHFTLYVRPNGEPQARIGIITSKRVAPRAVDRNRMKRLVREVFRSVRQRLKGLDLVVQLRRCPPRAATATARAEVARMLEELAAATGGN
jgi:ribonuclease P protein component